MIQTTIVNNIAFSVIFDFREMPTLKLANSGGAPGPEQNICFINAVLNLLFSVTAFRDFFQRKLFACKGQRHVSNYYVLEIMNFSDSAGQITAENKTTIKCNCLYEIKKQSIWHEAYLASQYLSWSPL